MSRKLREAQAVVEEEAGVRRRAMDRKLRSLEVLPKIEATTRLELEALDEIEADEEPPRGPPNEPHLTGAAPRKVFVQPHLDAYSLSDPVKLRG